MKQYLPYIFLVAALVALVFLMYSLHNREKLGIGLTHPRILVEGALFVILLSIALSMLLKKL